MSKIYKRFNSEEEAVRYQNKLYERFGIVRLVDSQRFSGVGSGQYVWEVR